MVKRILTSPHPALRRKCEEVNEFNEEVRNEVKDLEDTLKDNFRKAIGLAANQIGIFHRIIAFTDLENGNVVSLVNPRITYYSKDDTKSEIEACLSYPGRRKTIKRANEISVEGNSVSGILMKYSMEGMQARIVQHEIDHLNGVCKVGLR